VHVEFLPWSRIADVATAWEVVRLADRANAGIAVDAWHWFRGTPDEAALRTVPGVKILAVQLGDAPATAGPGERGCATRSMPRPRWCRASSDGPWCTT
jgi:sugar phosphate isomerase/epimerase